MKQRFGLVSLGVQILAPQLVKHAVIWGKLLNIFCTSCSTSKMGIMIAPILLSCCNNLSTFMYVRYLEQCLACSNTTYMSEIGFRFPSITVVFQLCLLSSLPVVVDGFLDWRERHVLVLQLLQLLELKPI